MMEAECLNNIQTFSKKGSRYFAVITFALCLSLSLALFYVVFTLAGRIILYNTCYGACSVVLETAPNLFQYIGKIFVGDYLFKIFLSLEVDYFLSRTILLLLVNLILASIILYVLISIGQHVATRFKRFANYFLLIRHKPIRNSVLFGFRLSLLLFFLNLMVVHLVLAMSFLGIAPYDSRDIPTEFFRNHNINFYESVKSVSEIGSHSSCLHGHKLILSAMKVDPEGINSFVIENGLKENFGGKVNFTPERNRSPSWWPFVSLYYDDKDYRFYGTMSSNRHNIALWYNEKTTQAYFGRIVEDENWSDNCDYPLIEE